ncbi:MAG: putative DNA binding domain-containing protein [Gammaproteobacteria bacterium]|nr:putative DNA binding domain-containing protein [Gammaproteobacteria bacterium]
MNDTQIVSLIDNLRKKPSENHWLEFKENYAETKMIGKLISALSNSAQLVNQPYAYVIWGIRDKDHEVVGTSFEPTRQMQNEQPLELWLSRRLRPDIAFSFESVNFRGTNIVLLKIPAASTIPVEFDRTAYIRIGSATPRLSDYPERQRELWGKLQSYRWEGGLVSQFSGSHTVLEKLDYVRYFDLMSQPLPDNRDGLLQRLYADGLVQKHFDGHWSITNLGAILFAKNLEDFPMSIARKAIRFVAYAGNSRADLVTHRNDIQRGYATGLDQLVEYISDLLPQNERINGVFREKQLIYPKICIRELVVNALIHQDMTISGTGPTVELFTSRLEITNPGLPLVSPERFIDLPPRSRNETLASFMRRMGFCEEQGTGIDKVISTIELHQLPPPDFRAEGDAVRVKLFTPRRFAEMTPDERTRACYQHASLKYVLGDRMKNSTLCKRFGIDPKNASQASIVFKKALDEGLIKPADPEHPRMGYLPFWA